MDSWKTAKRPLVRRNSLSSKFSPAGGQTACGRGRSAKSTDLSSHLRRASAVKRPAQQLLHHFCARRRSDGEDLRDCSHAPSPWTVELYSPAVGRCSCGCSAGADITARSNLAPSPPPRSELRRPVREIRELFDASDEGMMWISEGHNSSAVVVRFGGSVGCRLSSDWLGNSFTAQIRLGSN